MIKSRQKTAREDKLQLESVPLHTTTVSVLLRFKSKFVFDLRLNIKQKMSEATYRSASKINIIIRLRDLLCYKTNKCFSECESIHA